MQDPGLKFVALSAPFKFDKWALLKMIFKYGLNSDAIQAILN